MPEDRLIHTFHKNSAERVEARLRTYKGHHLAELRCYWNSAGDTWTPTKKGLCINVALLPELAEAVRKLREAAEGPGDNHRAHAHTAGGGPKP